MTKLSLSIIAIFFFSCKGNLKKDLGDFSLSLSNQNFNYDLENGVLKIPGIDLSDTIKLSQVQKKEIAMAFYKFHIDKLNGKKFIVSKNLKIMPDFNDVFMIRFKNIEKSELNISNQIKNTGDLNNTEIEILNFKKQFLEILNENIDFKNCMNTLKSNYKNLPPAM